MNGQNKELATRQAAGRCGSLHAKLRAVNVCITGLLLTVLGAISCDAESAGITPFRQDVEPVLKRYCFGCHGGEIAKGGMNLDAFKSNSQMLEARDLWWNVLKYLRAGIMPPPKHPRPTDGERGAIEQWIKTVVFKIDPQCPDPGRITVRRLNRVEYRNTIHDLLGVDFDTEAEFPADDTGYGFDTIGDVLTVSPMLLEKYIRAARAIVTGLSPEASKKLLFAGDIPEIPAERRQYAHEILGGFARKAFRRPVDESTLDRLTALAEGIYSQPGKTFESGVSHALVGVLSSPRFIFRLEQGLPDAAPSETSPVDEYSLASRMSYFLWSSMPDAELFDLAERHELRNRFASQVKRMLESPRSEAMIRNFTGQWLQTRDLEGMTIDAKAVQARDRGPERELDDELKRAMRRETEMCFASIVREDRSVVDLIDADYTFLNGRLAGFYGITNAAVTGAEMRRVALPPDSPRGGVLTQGAILVVTSNPDRTSPVKRGLFVLDNILGMPAPPPPPNVPALEASEKDFKDHEPTLRETLTLHRDKPLCASCHTRMDPIGLGLENFNAMGMWREKERGQPIDTSGRLVTGESFTSVRDLKQMLATRHALEFYRCLTEKLLTYALGRGLDYYDVETVDRIVQRLDREKGRFSALLMGIVDSSPFQRQRNRATDVFSKRDVQKADKTNL